MDPGVIRIVLLATCVWGVCSLQITNFTVPDFVENGTQEFVQLDCHYVYGINDTKLVVKWFHDDDPNPIYQWIPELGEYATTPKFGDRVISNLEGLNKFHAVFLLLRPTIEMTGTYSCQVTSMDASAAREAHMTIYAIPEAVFINISSVEDTVHVACIVEGVFPQPEVQLFHEEPGRMYSDPVEDVYRSYEEDDDVFDVFLTTNISRSELDSGLHFFGCTVSIEGTEYKEERRIPFAVHPRAEPTYAGEYGDDNDNGAFNMRPCAATTLIFVAAVLMFSWW